MHDAANILRRYFNQLPEPIIPLDFYQRFRDPLRHHQSQAVGEKESQGAAAGDFDADAAIKTYQRLITEIPPLNRQLLLYILDLLAVFASKSDLNLMNATNLSAIFQPGLLSHPGHDLSPPDYRLSQDVLIFLIENQDHFLVGMHGTAADEKTIQDVQSGPSPQQRPPAPGTLNTKTNQGVRRSISNASAGAESIRRFGGVRRNVSVSSKHSRQSNNSASPVSPPPGSPYSASGKSSGLHRSNTLPSKKSPSPATGAAHFAREKSPDPSNPGTAAHVISIATSPLSRESSTPAVAALGNVLEKQRNASSASPIARARDLSPHLRPVPKTAARRPSHDRQRIEMLALDMPLTSGKISPANTPSKDRSFSSFFKQSPGSDTDKKDSRRPNKLQKKRLPENANVNSVSAHSSSQDLSSTSHPPSPAFSPYAMHSQGYHSESEGDYLELSTGHVNQLPEVSELAAEDTSSQAPTNEFQMTDLVSAETPTATPVAPVGRLPTASRDMPQRSSGNTLKPTHSPTGSFSSAADYSSHDNADEEPRVERKKEKKRRWRISASKKGPKEVNSSNPTNSSLGSAAGAECSASSVASMGDGLSRARKGFTSESNPPTNPVAEPPLISDAENGGVSNTPSAKKGPLGWVRGKLLERKEREAEKERARSPPPAGLGEPSLSKQSLGGVIASDGTTQGKRKSVDLAREAVLDEARSENIS